MGARVHGVCGPTLGRSAECGGRAARPGAATARPAPASLRLRLPPPQCHRESPGPGSDRPTAAGPAAARRGAGSLAVHTEFLLKVKS